MSLRAAVRLAGRPAYYNEIDPYCCRLLRKQIAAGNLPPGDVDERDIRDVRASDLAGYGQLHLFAGIGGIPLGFRMAGLPDDFPIITGGFPCQDISNAGKRTGIAGERSGLWSEYARLIRDLRPAYVLVENVAALLGRGIGRVLGDLAAIGYDAEWHCIPACAVGAPHRRDRVWIVAHANSERCNNSPQRHKAVRLPKFFSADSVWFSELPQSAICRANDGVPARVDRLRGLGNAVVPQVVCYIAQQIMESGL